MPRNHPPEHLSDRSASLWRQVVPESGCSPGRLTAIQVALEALDRAEQSRRVVESEGLTTTTKTTGAVHVHPMLKVEREARAQFIQVWDKLGLLFHPLIDGRCEPAALELYSEEDDCA